jgi:NTE family protein
MTFKHLVLEGSGFSALAYCGAFEELEKRHILKDIKYFAGSSSGALLATLLAMNFTPKEIGDIFATYDFENVLSTSRIKMIWNLLWHFGLFSSNPIITRLKEIIKAKHDPDITFDQLFKKTGNFLVITVSSINEQQVFYISPTTHPNVKVIDAIQSSISIPLFFIPSTTKFDSISGMTVDGGVLDNYPIWIFNKNSSINTDRHTTIPENTLGLKITQPKDRSVIKTPTSLGSYIF